MISVDFRAHPGNTPGTTPWNHLLEPPPGTTGPGTVFLTDLIRGLWKAAGAVVPRVGTWRSSGSLASAKKKTQNSHIQEHAYLGAGAQWGMHAGFMASPLDGGMVDIAHETHEGGSGTHDFHKCTQERI